MSLRLFVFIPIPVGKNDLFQGKVIAQIRQDFLQRCGGGNHARDAAILKNVLYSAGRQPGIDGNISGAVFQNSEQADQGFDGLGKKYPDPVSLLNTGAPEDRGKLIAPLLQFLVGYRPIDGDDRFFFRASPGRIGQLMVQQVVRHSLSPPL